MRAAFAALALLAAPAPLLAQAGPPVKVQLDSMPLGALATLLMRDVMRVPYVIEADVLKDSRPVSVNLVMPRHDLPVRVVHFLRSLGLTVTLREGTVYVSKAPLSPTMGAAPSFGPVVAAPGEGGAQVPSGSPLAAQAGPPQVGHSFATRPGQARAQPGATVDQVSASSGPSIVAVIEPAHKPVLDLVDVLESMVPELTIAARRDSENQGTEIVDRQDPTSLVISGPQDAIDKAVAIVKLLDRPRPTVEIRAVVFEVRNTLARSSALSILASIGGVSVESSPAALPGEQMIRIATGGLKAVLSATRGDGRFKILAEPSLAALSGTVATINSGSQVPTVGAVTFSENGTPTRSIVYRDSGISLTVRPIVRGSEIELAVKQERSSFVRTTTGVDDTPTLNKSTSSAQITLRPGETVAMAGLDEKSEGESKSGFLGGLLGSRQKSKESGQMLLLIQADLAKNERVGAPVITLIKPPKVRPGATRSDQDKPDQVKPVDSKAG